MYPCVYVYVCVCVYIHVSVYVCMYVNSSVCMCMYVYVCLCVCSSVCVERDKENYILLCSLLYVFLHIVMSLSLSWTPCTKLVRNYMYIVITQ